MANSLVEMASGGKVILLRAGEEQERDRGFYAPASISLIKVPGLCSLVDVGCFGEENTVKDLLNNKGVPLGAISKIFITHNHPDHIGTIGMFKGAKVYMPDSRFYVDSPNNFELVNGEFYETVGNSSPLFTNCSLVNTPGHSGWDTSVLYTGEKAKILIAGDLFWSREDWNQGEREGAEFLSLCVDKKKQIRSREYVRLELKPDVVVPGHGEPFAPKY